MTASGSSIYTHVFLGGLIIRTRGREFFMKTVTMLQQFIRKKGE